MIRKLQKEDTLRLAEIHVFSWRTTYRKIVSDKFLFVDMTVDKSRKHFDKLVDNPNFHVYVHEEDKIIKGFIITKESTIIEIIALYVDPSMMRIGVGKKLFQYIENNIKNISKIKLTVGLDNKNAIKFYEKMGMNLVENSIAFNDKINIHTVEYEKERTPKLLTCDLS